MSKLLCNVLKISGGCKCPKFPPPSGCAPVIHDVVHISSSTVRRRLLQTGRKAKKPLKRQILTQKLKTKIGMCRKITIAL